MSERARDEGFDEFLDAVEAGEAIYLECPNGHGSLPPRRACPHCGSQELTEEPLAETGEVATYTEIHVATPEFVEDTPYITAVADFGPVRLTGMLRGIEEDAVETGLAVAPGVGKTETTGERVLVFHRG